jgi:hypothetical protein
MHVAYLAAVQAGSGVKEADGADAAKILPVTVQQMTAAVVSSDF